MPVQTVCPSCSVKLQIKDELIGRHVKCPKCGGTIRPTNTAPELSATGDWQKPKEPETLSLASPDAAGTVSYGTPDGQVQPKPGQPTSPAPVIGRYRVEEILGEGGFGVVYLAHDDELKRRVAIKVPQAHRIRSPKDAEAYLIEAQVLAKLDHPHIVPVYDVGRSTDGLPYVVSKFIEGSSLGDRIKRSRIPIREAVILVARMAEALQYAHQHRLVHRDVKPGNILLNTSNKPFLVDFGLALKEKDFGKGEGILGTPAYMSPEQACGEGHRVDGRSDIFSLGVVLYEMLAGQRPFQADSIDILLFHVATVEPRPLRQIDPAIPKELERITLKALAKKASERYATALGFADDLKHWLEPKASGEKGTAPFKVIPKGLRSFDANDADFFLELLPGPRDRDGLPGTLRFWKNRIEEMVAERTFQVGVIYGPSGCGKSSFVKAGLLPRLANSVRVVYIEATPEDTETRLLKGIQKACPELPDNLALREALAHLRRQDRPRQKIVLVLDQFEQWLHGKQSQENAELVQALRQCDGERVQAIVMVRDDFWMALTRFMRGLEIRLVEGENSSAVDLFDPLHAKKVLSAFGRAYGTLPEDSIPTKEQEAFLDQVVSGLSQEGKVISVRLALFAEMVRGKAWTPATLKEIGGTEGVGVTFLEETFSATTAPPEHRYHQNAARAVLKALLPEQGTDIKGQMRSHEELLRASGYAGRPKDFEDLLTILNSEVRLITPTDPAGKDSGETGGVGLPDAHYYQLTHDYLVHSLRDWLTRKQKETPRGRAELLLADRAAVWNARPENRQLPSLLPWMQIRWWTKKKTWTPPQKKMMATAGRYHAVRTAVVAVLLACLASTGLAITSYVREQDRLAQEKLAEQNRKAKEQQKEDTAAALVGRVFDADIAQASEIIRQMKEYRAWTDPLLKDAYAKAEESKDGRKKLHASLALLPVDVGQVDYLHQRLLKAEPQEVVVIREALSGQKAVTSKLWSVLKDRQNDPDQRLRAACALASLAPDEEARWKDVGGEVASMLVVQKPFVIARWTEVLQPVGDLLLSPLAEMLAKEQRSDQEVGVIANVFSSFAGERAEAYTGLEKWMTEETKQGASQEAEVALLKQKAKLSLALIIMGREEGWRQLRFQADPTLRTMVLEKLGVVNGKDLMARLEVEKDVTVKRSLLLGLAGAGDRAKYVPRLLEIYQEAVDPGVHGAAEWLLRQWGEEAKLAEADISLAIRGMEKGKNWYVNDQGQTMVIVPGPVEFLMGEEPGKQKKHQIKHSFAIASKEVTVAEFLRFRTDHLYDKKYAPTAACPVSRVSWYDAAAYCNWLSEQEGLPKEQWCYEPHEDNENKMGMKMSPDSLQRTGYRLPTEAEWEYAYRGGTDTYFSFGKLDQFMDSYAWHTGNSKDRSQPVGMLRPNDLGLYDMLGNLWEWTQDAYGPVPKESEFIIDSGADSRKSVQRVKRGNSFAGRSQNLRTSYRYGTPPTDRSDMSGFRPARTLPLGSFTALKPLPSSPP